LSDAPSVQDPRLQCFFMTFSKWFSNDPLSKSTTNVQIWSQSVQKLCFWLYEATLGSTCVVERFDDIENDKTKIFKRERMKNQPISKKKKSIFVKFSFAMRWKYHHLKLKPSMALHRLTPQSTIAFCMIYEWTMSSLFPPHAKMCQTNQLGKRLKNIFPSCVVAF